MRSQEKSVDFKISQFEFVLTPTEISFKNTEAQTYALQSCKGAQVYHKFEEAIWVHADEKSYRFSNRQSATLFFNSDKNLCCEWSIYKVNDDDLKQYLTSVPIDLGNCFKEVFLQMKQKSKEIADIWLEANQGKQISSLWTNLKEKIKFEKAGLKVLNERQGIAITFNLYIRYSLETVYQKEVKSQVISRKQSKLSNQGSKSNIQDEDINLREDHSIREQQSRYIIKTPQYTSKQKLKANKKQRKSSSNLKQNLSDVIEVTNSNSSVFNHEQKRLGLNSIINQIAEYREELESSIPATRTLNIQVPDVEEIIMTKRSNTVREQYQSQESKSTSNKASWKNFKEEPSILKSKLQTETELTSKFKEQLSQLPIGKKKKKTSGFCKIVFIIILLGFSSYFYFSGIKGTKIIHSLMASFQSKSQQKTTKGITKIGKKNDTDPNNFNWLWSWQNNQETVESKSPKNKRTETTELYSKSMEIIRRIGSSIKNSWPERWNFKSAQEYWQKMTNNTFMKNKTMMTGQKQQKSKGSSSVKVKR